MGGSAAGVVDPFPMLTDRDRQLLFAKGEPVGHSSGTVIVREGAQIDAILLVRKGVVRVIREYLDQLCAEFTGPLGPGEILGEISFVDGQAASATLVADGDVELLRFDRSHVQRLLDEVPGFAGRFYHSLMLTACRRLRATNLRVLPPAE
jgi:CRP-like cAMP-binding protein